MQSIISKNNQLFTFSEWKNQLFSTSKWENKGHSIRQLIKCTLEKKVFGSAVSQNFQSKNPKIISGKNKMFGLIGIVSWLGIKNIKQVTEQNNSLKAFDRANQSNGMCKEPENQVLKGNFSKDQSFDVRSYVDKYLNLYEQKKKMMKQKLISRIVKKKSQRAKKIIQLSFDLLPHLLLLCLLLRGIKNIKNPLKYVGLIATFGLWAYTYPMTFAGYRIACNYLIDQKIINPITKYIQIRQIKRFQSIPIEQTQYDQLENQCETVV